MNSRKLVKDTLEFSYPKRIPRQLWLLPWAKAAYPGEVSRIQEKFPDDIIVSPSFYKEPPKRSGDIYLPGIFVDEWGCIFENKQKGIRGKLKEPPLKEWKDTAKIEIPQALLSVDKEKVNSFCRNTEKFVLGGTSFSLFERLKLLRGEIDLLADLAGEPEELFVLIKKVHNFYLQEFELWVDTEVDGLLLMDDWGGRDSLLISPEMWREVFKPLYKEYARIAREKGKYLFMHSDGWIIDIIPDLIEIGICALNVETSILGIEILGERFRGKVTFWGGVSQKLLGQGTEQEILREAKKTKECLYQNGGVITQCEFGPGVRPENVYLLFKIWKDIF